MKTIHPPLGYLVSALLGVACLGACNQHSPSAKSVIPGANTAHPRDTTTVLLDAINRYRKQKRRSPLTVDQRLFMAADDHSTCMNQHAYFSHQGKDGRNFTQRMARHGYPRSHAAENIARAPDPNIVFQLWQDSKGHKINMLGKKYRRIGIARDGDYWTAVFAAPDGT